jgi:hypothetical protein
MADDTDVLLKFCEEHWAQARQSENQRATITSLIIVITSIVAGFIAQSGLGLQMLPLAIALIPFGLFGAVATGKLYERFHLHHDKVRYWRKQINDLHPNAQLLTLERDADDEHKKTYGLMARVRLHHLWVIFHLAIAALGIIFSALILIASLFGRG